MYIVFRALQRLGEQTKKQGPSQEKKAKEAAFLQLKTGDYRVQAKKLKVFLHACASTHTTRMSLKT